MWIYLVEYAGKEVTVTMWNIVTGSLSLLHGKKLFMALLQCQVPVSSLVFKQLTALSFP